MNLGSGIFRREFQNIANIGSPKCVKRLIIVADRPQLYAVVDELIDEPDLTGIDVLELVDEQVVITSRDRSAIGFAARHRLDHERNHVGEIDGARVLERSLIDAKIPGGLDENLVV